MRTMMWSYKCQSASIRKFIRNIVLRFDGGEFYSTTLRRIFAYYHGVDVGMYSHGGCFRVDSFSPCTTFGRYCSIAETARGFNRNHPVEYKSTHAFFFNPGIGVCEKEILEYTPLKVGNDVWIGHNAIILPIVKFIGDGAIIGAGAVINKSVPPYAVVTGNPSRIVKYRFNEETIKDLIESMWWDKPIEELRFQIDEFQNFKR
jgi:virginiamycin A acetyltransferase